MKVIYRLKAQEIGAAFLKSLKILFAGQEVEIIVKPVVSDYNNTAKGRAEMLQII